MNSHEVISAFLDQRTFELQELAASLEQPEGRALLIDLLALRRIVQPSDAVPVAPAVQSSRWSRIRPALAAAAVIAALASGYVWGVNRAPAPVVAESTAPAPTRVVQVTSTSEGLPQGVRR